MKITGLQNSLLRRTGIALFLAGSLGLPLSPAAQEIYKSVDAEGNVTYSSVPPQGAVETQPVFLPEGPTEAEQQQAMQRSSQLQQEANRISRQSELEAVRRSNASRNAVMTLDDAKTELEEAKQMKDSDWQNMAGGGRHLKESYFERVQEAEENLRKAEQGVLLTQPQ